jgi:hypothetical protein
MSQSFVPNNCARFEAALQRFDEENGRDPHLESDHGVSIAREVLYARWVSDWILRLKPEASEALRLAGRGVHLCRWAIDRKLYPSTRAGYLRWRQELKSYHARKVGEILLELAYPQDLVFHVQGLVSKASFPADPDSQVLEDALCLVFLEHQFSELARKSSEEKMINALQKTWKKMSPRAREIARTLPYAPEEKVLLERALAC